MREAVHHSHLPLGGFGLKDQDASLTQKKHFFFTSGFRTRTLRALLKTRVLETDRQSARLSGKSLDLALSVSQFRFS
jgi:hypothetical protein